MNRPALAIAIAGLVVAWPEPAGAQVDPDRFELGVQVSSVLSSEFEHTDSGLGGRLSWHPVGLVGIESEINLYPRDFPDQVPFSRSRVEGLFGVTVGPGFDRARPFARLRSGFLNVRKAPRPFACILIFPPPLSCELGSGRTLIAFDIGGGVEVFTTRKTVVRVDVGDRIVRFTGPVFDKQHAVREDGFLSHDLRFAAGAALRF